MTDRELMQMALNALEKHVLEYETAEALRARLAQPDLITPVDVEQLARIEKLIDKIDPYEAQPEPEPVAWIYKGNLHPFDPSDWAEEPVRPLYTTPSQLEWQGLTEYEVGFLTVFDGLHDVEVPLLANFIRHIEAKLKEKNGFQK